MSSHEVESASVSQTCGALAADYFQSGFEEEVTQDWDESTAPMEPSNEERKAAASEPNSLAQMSTTRPRIGTATA